MKLFYYHNPEINKTFFSWAQKLSDVIPVMIKDGIINENFEAYNIKETLLNTEDELIKVVKAFPNDVQVDKPRLIRAIWRIYNAKP